MAKTKLQREQDKILTDMRAMYRRHIRAAVDNDDVKSLTDLIKSAMVAKNWQWIYDDELNPWAIDDCGNRIVTVKIYGEDELLP